MISEDKNSVNASYSSDFSAFNSYSQQFKPMSSSDFSKSDMNRGSQKSFRYTNKLFLALIPPLVVVLMFGGKPTLLVFCFGAIGGYIFDLLGSLEGTMLAIVLTLVFVWASLFWAARTLLQESLFNMTMINIFGSLLVCLFFVICGNFEVLAREFPSMMVFAESFVFALLPLQSATILTWFISVEIQSVDVAIAFSVIYYTYLSQLCYPHRSYLKNATDRESYVLYAPVIVLLDICPIAVSGLISISSHHMVLLTSWRHFITPMIPMTLSYILMTSCLDSQQGYFSPSLFNEDHATPYQLTVEASKLLAGAVLVCFFQDNPAFDDIKLLVYHRKAIVSLGICTLAFLGALTLFLYRLRKSMMEESIGFSGRSSKTTFIYDLAILAASGTCAWLASYILNLSFMLSLISALGGMALSEYYLGRQNSVSSGLLKSCILVIFASFAAGLDLQSFLSQTLSTLMLELTWVQDISIQQLSMIVSLLGSAAVIVPAIGHYSRREVGKMEEILPSGSPSRHGIGSGFSKVRIGGYTLPSNSFEVLFQFVAMIITAIELMIREQDWRSDLHVDVEAVYPAYILMLTGLLISFTAYHCWTLQLMRLSAVWLVWLSQSIKLLHLVGLPSLAAGAVGALVYALMSPFISIFQADDVTITILPPPSSAFGFLVMIWQLFQAGLSVFWFYRHIARRVFVLMLSRDPSNLQVVAGCVSLYSLFLAAYSFFYIPYFSILRSISMIVGVLSTLIATDTISAIDIITIDWNSPTIITISTIGRNARSVEALGLHTDSKSSSICLFLSCFLIAAATYNIFPIKKLPYRLSFLLLFSLTTTEALLGWAYPLNLSSDSPEHGFFDFPFIHTVVLVIITTSTGLHSTLAKASETGEKIFLLTIVWILGGLAWTSIAEQGELFDGVLWSTVVVGCGIAVVTSAAQLLRYVSGLKNSVTGMPSHSTVTATTVCALGSIMAIAAAVALSTLGHHRVELDFLVPIISTVLMTTKSDLIFDDIHSAELTAVTCIVWWLLRAVYCIFIHGYDQDALLEGFQASYGLFHNASISMWTSTLPRWIIIFNALVALIPIPAVVLSFVKRKNESEELMFVLAIACVLPLIGSHANCIRFLGGVATVYASWRCYEIGLKRSISSRVI